MVSWSLPLLSTGLWLINERLCSDSDCRCSNLQIAIVGFSLQALVTRKGPIENLVDHISNPFGNNFITSIGNLPQTLSS